MKLKHKEFLDEINSKITQLGIDISKAKLDHIAYQASSSDEYDKLKPQFVKIAELMKEPIVGGRRVGVFKFSKPLKYKDDSISAIELIEPKADQNLKSGLEHAEYLLPESLEDFMKKYPDIDWDTSALNRNEFPMLILKLNDSMRVKFPRNPILANN